MGTDQKKMFDFDTKILGSVRFDEAMSLGRKKRLKAEKKRLPLSKSVRDDFKAPRVWRVAFKGSCIDFVASFEKGVRGEVLIASRWWEGRG